MMEMEEGRAEEIEWKEKCSRVTSFFTSPFLRAELILIRDTDSSWCLNHSPIVDLHFPIHLHPPMVNERQDLKKEREKRAHFRAVCRILRNGRAEKVKDCRKKNQEII
jgi:hypothetical protein